MPEIPVIDIAALFDEDRSAKKLTASAIVESARDTGFLSVIGTGISPQLTQTIRTEMAQLFSLDEAVKRDRAITRENYRGFIPFGFFTPNDGSGKADLYEAFKLHLEVASDDPIRENCSLYGPNLWPPEFPVLRDSILTYWRELDRLCGALLDVFADDLRIEASVLRDAFEMPLTNMTLLHYPPQPDPDDGYGIHPHKDTDALTIISPDPVGGLEVFARNGTWIEVDCPADGFVVNIGDMLELWSGGRFVSTPHRVINRSGRERYSFPWFAVPRHDVTVRPLVEPLPGFSRPPVHCGRWSAEIWRTYWPDEAADDDTPELGTLHV